MQIQSWRGRLAGTTFALAILLQTSTGWAQQGTFGRDYLIGELTPITDLDGPPENPPSVDLDIPFEYDSARLTASARAQLTELGHAIMAPALRTSRFGIYGHTDAAGSDDYNLRLSIRRAGAVRDFLLESFDITPDRLEVAGYGETRLKYPETPRDGRNRRVEVVNLTPIVAVETKPEPQAEAEPEPPAQPTRPTSSDFTDGFGGGSLGTPPATPREPDGGSTGFGSQPMGGPDFGGGFESAPQPDGNSGGGVPFY